MSASHIDRLRLLASRFRSAILLCAPECLPAPLKRFPQGACGYVAPLLGHYLSENGCGRYEYVLGERMGHSHAWLGRRQLIIDITADQFDDNEDAVIVAESSEWHDSFNGRTLHMAGIHMYGRELHEEYLDVYRTITEIIANNMDGGGKMA